MQLIFIVGPTAVGKTQAAISLAKKIKGEIISCDSMQVYKGMAIISSQPTGRQAKSIPHHLIGTISPRKEYNVSLYRQAALKKISQILKKGKQVIFVGGTGLYMSILVDGIFELKAQDKKIRRQLTKEAVLYGSRHLHSRLAQVDPQAAGKIHPNDAKRIIRALEVYKVTGKPISLLQKQRKGLSNDYDIKIFCLNMRRDKLYSRIEKRVDKMFKSGLVQEVKRLLKFKLSRTAASAIGIKEIKGYLEGLYDLNEAKRMMKRNTCLYAKRQLTWFRKDKRIKWVEAGEEKVWNAHCWLQ